MKNIFLILLLTMTTVLPSGCSIFGTSGKTQSMKELAEACIQYAHDHSRIPPERLDMLKPDYIPQDFDVVNYKIMVSEPLTFNRPGNVVMLCDTRALSGGRRVVAYADGQVEIISEYQSLKPMAALSLSCIAYAARYKKLPERLEDLKEAHRLSPKFDLTPYELVSQGSIDNVPNPSEIIMLREKTLSPDGRRVVAFVDGHIELARE